jgi:hypothetical protein
MARGYRFSLPEVFDYGFPIISSESCTFPFTVPPVFAAPAKGSLALILEVAVESWSLGVGREEERDVMKPQMEIIKDDWIKFHADCILFAYDPMIPRLFHSLQQSSPLLFCAPQRQPTCRDHIPLLSFRPSQRPPKIVPSQLKRQLSMGPSSD